MLPQPCLMLVTEPHPNLREVVVQAIAGGVNVVQLRDKAADCFQLVQAAWHLEEVVQPPALLVINGANTYIMRKTGCGTQLSIAALRAMSFEHKYLPCGVSVHTVAEAREAEQLGADYLIAGTIFASQSHPDIAPQGLGFLRDVCASVTIPTLAIGGITPVRVAGCVKAGAAGVAVLSPLMRADAPELIAREYWRALQEAWKAKQCA